MDDIIETDHFGLLVDPQAVGDELGHIHLEVLLKGESQSVGGHQYFEGLNRVSNAEFASQDFFETINVR